VFGPSANFCFLFLCSPFRLSLYASIVALANVEKALRNAVKISDWSAVVREWDNMEKQLEKNASLIREKRGALPESYLRSLVFLNRVMKVCRSVLQNILSSLFFSSLCASLRVCAVPCFLSLLLVFIDSISCLSVVSSA
jgi:hypothetical protein